MPFLPDLATHTTNATFIYKIYAGKVALQFRHWTLDARLFYIGN